MPSLPLRPLSESFNIALNGAREPAQVEMTKMRNYLRDAQSAIERDRNELARVGKKEVLRRNFAFMSMLGFGCIVLNTWEGVLILFVMGFANGGPSGLVYGFIITWIGTLSIFTVLSELSSMVPTSGGQYYWCAMLGPRKYRKLLSYVTGWLTVCGWQGAATSAFLLAGSIVQSLIILNNDTYEPKSWQALLIMYACIIGAVLTNTVVSSFLPAIEGAILICHVVGFFAILITVTYLAPVHNSATEVFNFFLNNGGWPTQGLSVFIGMISTVFIFLGADSVIHMSEEVQNASVTVPRATVMSIMVNGALGFGMLIGILFSLGDDLKGLLKSPYGYPFIQIFMNSTRSRSASTVLTAVLLALIFFSTIGVVATASRMTWSFARDRGLPGWKTLSKVDSRTSIPFAAISLTAAISVLLLLISLGSSTALNDIISFSVNSFYGSYMISAALLLWCRLTGRINEPGDDVIASAMNANGDFNLVWGPWRLRGWWGIANNAFACAWMTVVLFFSSWPNETPVTAATMNYSIFITIFVVVASAMYYWFWAKKAYVGAIVEVEAVESREVSQRLKA